VPTLPLKTQNHTVVIAISASVFEEDHQKSLAAGCNDFSAQTHQGQTIV
jgi:CheY-like chemotaxis protein